MIGLAAVVEWEAQHGALTEAELTAARERVASQIGRKCVADRAQGVADFPPLA